MASPISNVRHTFHFDVSVRQNICITHFYQPALKWIEPYRVFTLLLQGVANDLHGQKWICCGQFRSSSNVATNTDIHV